MDCPCHKGQAEKTTYELLFFAFLVVVWWVGLWGFLDTLLHQVIKGSTTTALLVYGGLVGFVLLVIAARPRALEHFI